jgi:3-oxoacyl-[acyl-carrier-protein] synthase II
MSRRVVITGLGVVTPVGKDVPTFWDSLLAGKSGIGRVESFDTTDYPCKIAGEVKDIDFSSVVEPKEVNRTDRNILFALYAAKQAILDSGLDLTKEDLTRFGAIIGSGIGGLKTLETEHAKLLNRGPSRVSPFLVPMMISDMGAGRVSIEYGLKGPNFSVVSACASGGHSLGEAFLGIKAGMMDIAIAGGCEAGVTPLSFAGFCSLKALSTRNEFPEKASSPFDKKRDGFVMGEGSGLVVLESLEHALARNARIYGELLGYGATGDAYHITAPAPDGDGAARAMQMALTTAGITAADVDYINAHGTSTDFNDKLETKAVHTVFGESAGKVNISSTKSITGHLLGASGGIEFVATVLSICNNMIHPTINYEDPDPECDLNYTPNTAVAKTVRYAMSNSFGFGGHNASLVIGKYESA